MTDQDAGDDPAATATGGYVIVRVGGGRYAISMTDVGEIGRSPEVTRVPGVAAFVAGMANWRGSPLALLDARVLLGLAAGAGNAHLVVVRREGVEIGLLVDAVEGVANQATSLHPVPASVSPDIAGLLAGTVLDAQARPVAVLDAAALVALRMRVR